MAEEVLVVCSSSSDEEVDDVVDLTKSSDSECESECDFENYEGKKPKFSVCVCVRECVLFLFCFVRP